MNDISTLKKSLLMIQQLKKRLQEQKDRLYEPVAIIGMSCRLTQTNNPQEYWDLLCQGKNMITPIPDARWDLLKETDETAQRDASMAYWGSYLANIENFDAYFFGISPREATRMDPQQRMLLEVAYESLEDAGLTAEALAGSNTGVFSSVYASQFGHLQQLDNDMDALFIPTGSAVSMAANRLSYLFDLRGPSMVLDTACSSSLIAVQLACLNLQAKLCDQAIVSAVNINLLPSIHSVLSKATMLSPTGQCKTFDAGADGYVQGEGAGSIVLKPLSKALADKDRIYAVITGSAVNQDGKTNGLTAPNGLQQEDLLRSAYKSANTNPEDISYIECHGTGTFLGDPIEIKALGEVVGKNRAKDKPCWISSVKTNLGHLEPAAGIASIIKVALVLKHGIIPPHLNFNTPNPHIPFDQYSLAIPQKLETLPRYKDVSIAGVSGFGFGGANAHVVLRELSAQERFVLPPVSSNEPELFTLSAKDPAALQDFIGLWCAYLNDHPETNLAQLCYNLHKRRSHYAQRVAIVAHSTADLAQKLNALHADFAFEDAAIFINRELKKTNNTPTISDFAAMDLSTLANHYSNNANIDWQAFEAGRFYAHLDMPFYPWQHKKYWPTLGKAENALSHSNYPLRGRYLFSPLTTRQFEFVFDTKAMPEVQDTFHVLHAGYYLEMLAYAVKELHQTKAFSLQNLSFSSPLLVPHGNPVLVHLTLETAADDSVSFSFYSNHGRENWIGHAKGTLSLAVGADRHFDAKEDGFKQATSPRSSETFYQRVTGMGMPAGDTIQWTNQFWLGTREIFCELRKPKSVERGEQFAMQVHPGIIDACIQTLFLLLPEEFTKPYVASHMSNVTFYGKEDDQMFIYTRLKEVDPEGKKIIGDWFLVDKNQRLIAKCEDVCMTQLNNTMQIEQMVAIESQFQLDLSLPYEECKIEIMEYLSQQFALIFSMPVEDINVHHSLQDLGMDSLMALAVMRIIETNLNVTYALPTLMQGPSIHDIAEHVLAGHSMSKPQVSAKAKSNQSTIWLANRKIQPEAQVRLFCFPYGGGGASIYREWQQDFPDSIEVCPIQLPGRENRMDEEPMAHLDTLIPLLAEQLQPVFDLPFAFFGHSFGALIGFELTRYLRRHKMRQPVHLFASAYPDPRMPSKSLDNLLAKLNEMSLNLFDLDQERIGQLSDEQLTTLSIIFKDNGIVDYSDERMNKSIVQVLLPIFIGDMNIVRNYRHRNEAPLNIPTTVFLGKQDTWVAPEDHMGWADHSLARCDFHQFDSGHLFIREREVRLQVIQKITAELLQFSAVV